MVIFLQEDLIKIMYSAMSLLIPQGANDISCYIQYSFI